MAVINLKSLKSESLHSLSKNWFDATNFQISLNCGLKFEHPVNRLFLRDQES